MKRVQREEHGVTTTEGVRGRICYCELGSSWTLRGVPKRFPRSVVPVRGVGNLPETWRGAAEPEEGNFKRRRQLSAGNWPLVISCCGSRGHMIQVERKKNVSVQIGGEKKKNSSISKFKFFFYTVESVDSVLRVCLDSSRSWITIPTVVLPPCVCRFDRLPVGPRGGSGAFKSIFQNRKWGLQCKNGARRPEESV